MSALKLKKFFNGCQLAVKWRNYLIRTLRKLANSKTWTDYLHQQYACKLSSPQNKADVLDGKTENSLIITNVTKQNVVASWKTCYHVEIRAFYWVRLCLWQPAIHWCRPLHCQKRFKTHRFHTCQQNINKNEKTQNTWLFKCGNLRYDSTFSISNDTPVCAKYELKRKSYKKVCTQSCEFLVATCGCYSIEIFLRNLQHSGRFNFIFYEQTFLNCWAIFGSNFDVGRHDFFFISFSTISVSDIGVLWWSEKSRLFEKITLKRKARS